MIEPLDPLVTDLRRRATPAGLLRRHDVAACLGVSARTVTEYASDRVPARRRLQCRKVGRMFTTVDYVVQFLKQR